MSDMSELRWRCNECNVDLRESQIIAFPDPEDSQNFWSICPNCRCAEGFTRLCDEPGCAREASCGTPVKDERRYVNTCHEHRPQEFEIEQPGRARTTTESRRGVG